MAEDISNVSAGDGEIQKCYSSAPRRLPAVGRVYNAAGQRSAVRWAPDGAGGYTLQDLGDLGGGEADARTINHAGQVAGYSTKANGGGALRAALWTPGQAIEELALLQSQGGSSALALSEVVGGPVYISGWGVGTARGSNSGPS